MQKNRSPILCIEDDTDTCELITFIFTEAGYEVESCSQLDCLHLIHEKRFSAIILDNYFHDKKGTELCQEIRSINDKIPIIFFSGEVRQTEVVKALAEGANFYLTKPEGFDELVPTTLRLIEQFQTSA